MEIAGQSLIRQLKWLTASSTNIAMIHVTKYISYETLWKSVDTFASRLESEGIHPCEIVGFSLANRIESVVALLAIWQIGAIPFLFPEKLFSIVQKEQMPKFFLAHPSHVGVAVCTLLSSGYDITTLVQGDLLFCRREKSYASDIIFNDFDGSTLLWVSSSGTTSAPKIVRLSLNGTLTNITANIEALGLSDSDTSLACLSINYSYGLIGQLLSHLYVGGRIVFPSNQRLVHSFPKLIASMSVTNIFTVPLIFRSLLFIVETNYKANDSMKSLRLCTIGGDAIDRHSLLSALTYLTYTDLAITYGIVEAGPRVSTYFPKTDMEHIGSVGQPLKGVRVTVVDNTGTEVPDGHMGEIVVESCSVMRGYALGSSKAKFIPEVMVYTGDYGYKTRDGYLYILGRKSDMIDIGGKQVFPNEIKEAFFQHPDVLHVDISGTNTNNDSKLVITIIPKYGKTIKVFNMYDLYENLFPYLADKTTIEVSHKPLPPSRIK